MAKLRRRSVHVLKIDPNMAKMPIFHFFADLANFDDKKIILRVLWSSKYSRITWYGYIRSHWDQKNDFQNFGSTPP